MSTRRRTVCQWLIIVASVMFIVGWEVQGVVGILLCFPALLMLCIAGAIAYVEIVAGAAADVVRRGRQD